MKEPKDCKIRQTSETKKKQKSIDFLFEATEVVCNIICSKCNTFLSVMGVSEYESASHFYEKGWRATAQNVYCPDCAARHLTPAKGIDNK